MSLRVLDLFSGIGGFSLGLERAGMRTVAFCEREPYCQRVLAKHWPVVPIYDDVRTLSGDRLAADGISVDVICGGFPCQPFSHAGKQRGKEDNRYLWPEMLRVIADVRPAWVIGENVDGIVRLALDTVLSDLEGIGYACRAFVIPAAGVDAPHLRRRVWIVAGDADRYGESAMSFDAEVSRLQGSVADADRESWRSRWSVHSTEGARGQGPDRGGVRANVADADGSRLEERVGQPGNDSEELAPFVGACRWIPEPDVGRVANGVPHRVDRLRALGNAVVPQIPELIGRAILAVTA